MSHLSPQYAMDLNREIKALKRKLNKLQKAIDEHGINHPDFEKNYQKISELKINLKQRKDRIQSKKYNGHMGNEIQIIK